MERVQGFWIGRPDALEDMANPDYKLFSLAYAFRNQSINLNFNRVYFLIGE